MATNSLLYAFEIPTADPEPAVATTPARAAADDMGLGRDEGSPGLVEKGQLTMPLNVKTRSRVRSDTEFANSKRVSFADSVDIREGDAPQGGHPAE